MASVYLRGPCSDRCGCKAAAAAVARAFRGCRCVKECRCPRGARRCAWWIQFRGEDQARSWVSERSSEPTRRLALAAAHERERLAERRLRGLEPMPSAERPPTLAQACQRYVDVGLSGRPSQMNTRSLLMTHVAGDIAATRLDKLSVQQLNRFFDAKLTELQPKSVKGLRGTIRAAINYELTHGTWQGANPISKTKPIPVPKKLREWVRPHEVAALIDAIDPEDRALFVVAVTMGLRKGELLGLKKCDVNMPERSLVVRRSWDRDQTKGKHDDKLPIPAEAAPWIGLAIDSSTSDLVFPGPDGKMRSRHFKAAAMLRRALGRAGVVDGYDHVCRKRGCGHVERATDAEQRLCPTHAMKLWPKPIPKQIRFHDLRASCVSGLVASGVSIFAGAKILRHTDPKITAEVYARTDPNNLRAEIDALKFGILPPAGSGDDDDGGPGGGGAACSKYVANSLLQDGSEWDGWTGTGDAPVEKSTACDCLLPDGQPPNHIRDQEVVGSNPVTPTTDAAHLRGVSFFSADRVASCACSG
ncbi:MAG: site-specific integrase [Deltaproteobacteria bacterium]|nr:site-specific integrase [Deltaproteobacteria bacterium]